MAEITNFSIQGNAGQIDGYQIAVVMPFGTDLSNLIAEFSGQFSFIKINDIVQESGITANDFTNPVIYEVSDDGIDFVAYTVSVSDALNIDNLLKSVKLPDLNVDGVINQITGSIEFNVDENAVLNTTLELELPEGATSNIVSGSVVDLSSNVPLIITSESRQPKNYLLSAIKHPDHSNNKYSIYRMVLARLPFLEDTVKTQEAVSAITLEVMFELENCFAIGETENGYDSTRIGKELYYDIFQKSIIADLISLFVITTAAIRTVAGDKQAAEHIEPQLKYISGVVAGSVEVNYDMLSIKDKALLAMDTTMLLGKFQDDAARKLAKLGCNKFFDLGSDSSVPYVGFITSGRAL